MFQRNLLQILPAVFFFFVSCLSYSLILQMKAVWFSKTWAEFHWTIWHYVPENNILHSVTAYWESSWNLHFKFKHQVKHYLKSRNPRQESEHIKPVVRIFHVKFFQILLRRFEVAVSFWALKIGSVVSIHTLHYCFEAISEECNIWQPLKVDVHVL